MLFEWGDVLATTIVFVVFNDTNDYNDLLENIVDSFNDKGWNVLVASNGSWHYVCEEDNFHPNSNPLCEEDNFHPNPIPLASSASKKMMDN